MLKIHPVQTGFVRIKTAQRRRRPGGLIRVLLDTEWTEWLPILAWVIEHPEQTIVVDTGDTARTTQPGYFPTWHPYYRSSVQMDITPDQEIGPQMEQSGLNPAAVDTVVLTHFHTDHAGGLAHFSESRILVEGRDYRTAKSLVGRLQGFLPHRWPDRFAPEPIEFEANPVGPFEYSHSLTERGDVLVVPTPGHTPHHVSVIVRDEDVTYFLAGDTSYTDQSLLEKQADGVSPRKSVTLKTFDRILEFCRTEPTVYLPTHDPKSIERLKHKQTMITAA